MAWDERYRMLEKGEIIQSGDEVLISEEEGWIPAKAIGECTPDPQFTAHRIYRRLKAER